MFRLFNQPFQNIIRERSIVEAASKGCNINAIDQSGASVVPQSNNRKTLIVITALSILIGMSLGASLAISQQKVTTLRHVKRVKRPKFDRKQWQMTYFDNLFEQGLVGDRPDASSLAASRNTAAAPTTTSENAEPKAGSFAWSTYCGSEVIEDEIKSLQQRLQLEVTTPAKFKTEYAKARQTFSMLSMMFAMVREFDGDIRWKKSAGQAQADFERAAANARVGTSQAYQSCKTRKENLVEMVRGGNFASDSKVPDELDWSMVIDRTPIMKRLKVIDKEMKTMVANKTEFSQNMETVFHSANLVAAMGVVLAKDEMPDGDDEDYSELALAMQKAASDVIEACKNNDYDAASTAANAIFQSCDDCHNDWR